MFVWDLFRSLCCHKTLLCSVRHVSGHWEVPKSHSNVLAPRPSSEPRRLALTPEMGHRASGLTHDICTWAPGNIICCACVIAVLQKCATQAVTLITINCSTLWKMINVSLLLACLCCPESSLISINVIFTCTKSFHWSLHCNALWCNVCYICANLHELLYRSLIHH